MDHWIKKFQELRKHSRYMDGSCALQFPSIYLPGVPGLTKTKPKYRNKTEIPEQNMKIIGKHIQVPKLLMDDTNAFLI